MKKYFVHYLKNDFKPSGSFDNKNWNSVESLKVNLWPWKKDSDPSTPKVEAQLLYSDLYLYVKFFVKEHYILAKYIGFQQKVHLDSCVEFFISPNDKGYFNFELNCVGSMHLFYRQSKDEKKAVEDEDIKKILIATSLKNNIISEPIKCPESGYIVEYAVPLELFSKYSTCSKPQNGTVWKGNFYKCGDDTPEPSWGVWSNVLTPEPDFHRPEYFGDIIFK